MKEKAKWRFRPAYWIISGLFLLLPGQISTIHIGGKNLKIFYEDFYLLVLVFFFITICLQKRKRKFVVSNYAPYILFFLIACILSLIVTPDLLRGIGVLKLFLTGFLAFFICINVISKESDIYKIIYFLPLFGAIIGGWLYYNVSTAGTLIKSMVFISWGRSNYLATFFILLIPMTIGLLFYKKNSFLIKSYLFASLVLMIIGLITTQSKGGLIAFSIALLIFLFKVFRKNKLRVVSIIILLALIITLHPATNVVFHKIYDAFYRRSLTGREIIYQEAIKVFLSHPFIGAGLGSLQYYMEQFTGRASYKAHNEYLQILAEVGILGLIFFASLFVISYKNIRRLIKTSSEKAYVHLWAIGILAGFIGMLIHIFVEPSFIAYQFFVFFWIVMGLIYINLKTFKEKWIIPSSQS